MDRRAALELRPPRLEQRVAADAEPDDVESGGRVSAYPAAVYYEVDRTDDVHDVVGARVPLELPGREQRVRADDESGADPADHFDCDFHGAPLYRSPRGPESVSCLTLMLHECALRTLPKGSQRRGR